MNDFSLRFIDRALARYDEHQGHGMTEARALYTASASLAASLGVTREAARRLLVDSLAMRREAITARNYTGVL